MEGTIIQQRDEEMEIDLWEICLLLLHNLPLILSAGVLLGGCKIFCVYGNETFRIRIRYVGVFVGFCNRIFCRIYLSGYSISRLLSFIHASSIFTC